MTRSKKRSSRRPAVRQMQKIDCSKSLSIGNYAGQWSTYQIIAKCGETQNSNSLGWPISIEIRKTFLNAVGYAYQTGGSTLNGVYKVDFAGSLENIVVWVIKIPEDISPGTTTPYDHPEWVICRKYLGRGGSMRNDDDTGVYDNAYFTVTSKRRKILYPGDRILLLITGDQVATGTNDTADGVIQFEGLVETSIATR